MYIDPDYMSVDDIKEKVVTLGFSKERIKEMYFSSPNALVEDGLLPIHSNKEMRELINLWLEGDYMSIYIEHNDNEKGNGKGVLVNQDSNESARLFG